MNNALISSFVESSWFGRAIIVGLFLLSIYSWAIIAMKWRMIKEIGKNSNRFLAVFQRTKGDILSLYHEGKTASNSPFETLYQSICHELTSLLSINGTKNITNLQLNTLSELAERTISAQILGLEKYSIALATSASVSPQLGLLGTVWGVLLSFRQMGIQGNASISVVAPGIAEALVTTVAGLIVALPSLAAYNWITNRIQTLSIELENFSSRLISYIQILYTPTSSTALTTTTAYEKEPAF